MRQKHAKRLPSGARYGSFLSVGDLLGIDVARLKDAIKVQFLPQWEGDDQKKTDAVLSKRFVLLDMRNSDVGLEDVRGLAKLSGALARAVADNPDELLSIAAAFGRSGTKEARLNVLNTATRLGLFSPDDSEPTAIWGVGLLIGAAILLAGCCQETDTDCSDDGDTGDTGDKPD